MIKTYTCVLNGCGKEFQHEQSDVLDVLAICPECKTEEYARLKKDVNEQMKGFAQSVSIDRLKESERLKNK